MAGSARMWAEEQNTRHFFSSHFTCLCCAEIMYCGIFPNNLMNISFLLSATTNVWGQEQHKYISLQMIPRHIPLRTLAKEMKYL